MSNASDRTWALYNLGEGKGFVLDEFCLKFMQGMPDDWLVGHLADQPMSIFQRKQVNQCRQTFDSNGKLWIAQLHCLVDANPQNAAPLLTAISKTVTRELIQPHDEFDSVVEKVRRSWGLLMALEGLFRVCNRYDRCRSLADAPPEPVAHVGWPTWFTDGGLNSDLRCAKEITELLLTALQHCVTLTGDTSSISMATWGSVLPHSGCEDRLREAVSVWCTGAYSDCPSKETWESVRYDEHSRFLKSLLKTIKKRGAARPVAMEQYCSLVKTGPIGAVLRGLAYSSFSTMEIDLLLAAALTDTTSR